MLGGGKRTCKNAANTLGQIRQNLTHRFTCNLAGLQFANLAPIKVWRLGVNKRFWDFKRFVEIWCKP